MKKTNKVQASKSSTESNSVAYLHILQAELLKRSRKQKNYSLRQFAIDLDVDAGSLSRIMNGTRSLSHTMALKMLPGLRLEAKLKKAFLLSVENNVASEASNVETICPKIQAKKDTIKVAHAKIDRPVVMNFKNKTLFCTTAVQGAQAHLGFMKAIDTFQKVNQAELFITTSKAHNKPLSETEYPLDDIFIEKYLDNIYRSVQFNQHLTLINLDVRPYVNDPLSGLSELGAEDQRSYIIAHTQQRMKTFPNGESSLPRIQQCSGACTKALYRDNKEGLLADKRHVVGGLVVEIQDGTFFVRVVQAESDGSFIDLGVRYNPNGTTETVRPEALVRGDDHVGFGDPKANCALDEVMEALRPKITVVHDLMDSASISHHRAHCIKAQLDVPEAMDTLEKELNLCREFLVDLNKKKAKDSVIYVVPANHNEHLHRYLNEGRFIKDMRNYKKAVELAYQYHVNGKDPLIHGVDPEQKLAKWLRRGDQTIRVAGIAISSHGDKGANGSRGSVKGDAVSYGKNTSGHSHSPEIWRGATRVGTSSLLEMDYTIGSPSSWAHCFELIYAAKDGSAHRQLVFVVNGKWRLNKNKDDKKDNKKVKASPAPAQKKKKRA